MAHITSQITGQVARRSITALIVALGLVAIVFVDQSIHWLLGILAVQIELPISGGSSPGLLFLFSLFFASAALFGFTILYRRSSDIGALQQGIVLGISWSTGAAALLLVTLLLPDVMPVPVFDAVVGMTSFDASLFLLDQIARGAFFDLFETMGWSLTQMTVNPDIWWFSATLVIFRAMTSVASVVMMVRLLGLRSQDMGLG